MSLYLWKVTGVPLGLLLLSCRRRGPPEGAGPGDSTPADGIRHSDGSCSKEEVTHLPGPREAGLPVTGTASLGGGPTLWTPRAVSRAGPTAAVFRCRVRAPLCRKGQGRRQEALQAKSSRSRSLEEADWARAQMDLPPRPVCGSQLRQLLSASPGPRRLAVPAGQVLSLPNSQQLSPARPSHWMPGADLEGAGPSTSCPLDVRGPESRWLERPLANHLCSLRDAGVRPFRAPRHDGLWGPLKSSAGV